MATARKKKGVAKKRGKSVDPTVNRDDEVEDDEELDDDDQGDLPEPKSKVKKSRGAVQRVRVVATRMGYDGIRRRREGEAFVVRIRSKDELPSWLMLESEYKKMIARKAEEDEAESDFVTEESDEDI